MTSRPKLKEKFQNILEYFFYYAITMRPNTAILIQVHH